MVTKYMFDKARELINQGKSDSEIGRILSIHRKTVARYRKSNTPPKYSRKNSTKADLYQDFSKEAESLLEVKNMTGSQIYTILKKGGYKGSERTVQRRISDIRKKTKVKERFFEQEYTDGEQSQFDFKESVELNFIDGVKVCHFHFGTLPCSDKFFISAYPYKNYEAFMNGCHKFFEHIGGLTKNVRIDNLSPCVSKVLKGNRRVFTAAFKAAIDHYGFGVLPCAPGKGSDKGDVERDIQTHARRFKCLVDAYGIVFRDWDDLNQQLLEYCIDAQNDEVKRKFELEKTTLLPIPQNCQPIINHVIELRCNSHGMVRLDRCKALYSVPDYMILQKCWVMITPFDVIIFEDQQLEKIAAQHKRLPLEQNSIQLIHVIKSLHRKPGALLRWKHKDSLINLDPVIKQYYTFLTNNFPESSDRVFLQTLNLVQHSEFLDIILAISIVMEMQSITPFDDIKELLVIKSSQTSNDHFNQSKIEPELTAYDHLIPDNTTLEKAS